MNQRIESLCLLAGLYAKLPNGNNYPVSMSAEEQCESLNKFAELIVRECATVVSKVPPGYKDYRDQIEEAMRDDCVAVILEHFGVEK